MPNNIKAVKEIDNSIGEKITYLRTTQGITRKELADKLGVTHQQLQKYEHGTNRISVSRLVEIANALQVHIIYFFESFMEYIEPHKIKKQRLYMEVMRDFASIPREDQQDALRKLIAVLAEKG